MLSPKSYKHPLGAGRRTGRADRLWLIRRRRRRHRRVSLKTTSFPKLFSAVDKTTSRECARLIDRLAFLHRDKMLPYTAQHCPGVKSKKVPPRAIGCCYGSSFRGAAFIITFLPMNCLSRLYRFSSESRQGMARVYLSLKLVLSRWCVLFLSKYHETMFIPDIRLEGGALSPWVRQHPITWPMCVCVCVCI